MRAPIALRFHIEQENANSADLFSEKGRRASG
jgi:hypothetical protein